MSKLYNQYINLKNNNSNKVYLFKCGVFYYFLDADAKKISDLFNFKLLPFTGEIFKCSIPVSRLGYYISEFQKRNMEFEIIDNQYSEINNYNDYLNNIIKIIGFNDVADKMYRKLYIGNYILIYGTLTTKGYIELTYFQKI